MRRASILVLAAAAVVCPAPAQGPPPVPHEAAVLVDSWNRADRGAYGENYWPEAELVDPAVEDCPGHRVLRKPGWR